MNAASTPTNASPLRDRIAELYRAESRRAFLTGPSTLAQRLESVLRVIYLVFNEGYTAAFGDDLTRRDLSAEALQPVHTATTLQFRNGKLSMTDGPFAETKEQLTGFYLVDATDLDAAIQIAAKIPPARLGSIEVRPVEESLRTERRYD